MGTRNTNKTSKNRNLLDDHTILVEHTILEQNIKVVAMTFVFIALCMAACMCNSKSLHWSREINKQTIEIQTKAIIKVKNIREIVVKCAKSKQKQKLNHSISNI